MYELILLLKSVAWKDILYTVGSISAIVLTVIKIREIRFKRAKPTVVLEWDARGSDPKYFAELTITKNCEREVIEIKRAGIILPSGELKFRVDEEGYRPKRLTKNAPSAIYIIPQEGLEPYWKEWRKIKGFAEDYAGNCYYSKPVSKLPSWVGGRYALKDS